MSTHTDGAPPSVAPEPDNGSGSAETAGSGSESGAASGVTWLQAEMRRRMAAARNDSGGRHARHGGPDPAPAQAEYKARHASDRAAPAGRRAAGLPSPVQPTRGDDGAEVPTAWTRPRDYPAPPRPRSGVEGAPVVHVPDTVGAEGEAEKDSGTGSPRPPLKAVPTTPADIPAQPDQSSDAPAGESAAVEPDAAEARPAALDPAVTAERAAAALAEVAPATSTVDQSRVAAPEADADGVVVPFPTAASAPTSVADTEPPSAEPASGAVVSTVDELVDTTAAAAPGVPPTDEAATDAGPLASADEPPAERPVPSTWSGVGPPRTEDATPAAPSPARSRPAGDAIGGLGGPSLPNMRAVRRPRAVPLSDTWARRVARQPPPPLPEDAPASATAPPDAASGVPPQTPPPDGVVAPDATLPPRPTADAGLQGQAHLLDGEVAADGGPLWQPPRPASSPAAAPDGDPARQPPGLDGPSVAARLARQVPDLASMVDTGPGLAISLSAAAPDTRQAPPADPTPPAWPGQPSDGVEVRPARPGQPSAPSPRRGSPSPSDGRFRPAPPSGPAAARLLSDPPSLPPTVAIPTVPGIPAATPAATRPAPAPVDPDDDLDDDDLDDDYAEDPDEADGVIWRAASPAPQAPAPVEPPPAPVYPPGKRVRVVLAERKAAARPVRTVIDIQEDGAVGEVLRSGLIKSQLRVAMGFALIGGLPLFLLPAVFDLFPDIGSIAIFGLRLPWLLLGVLVYPFLFGLGWWFTHVAERVEQDFADHVQD
jgi:hypothetical protein